MESYVFPHLADDTVLQGFDASLSHTCAATSTMLAWLGEVDERRLYLRAAYPSMFQYCVHEKRMSEPTAHKRIRVARMARQFPAIFPALADGRLRLSAVLLLAPHLSAETADELVAAAADRTNAEIELLLAHRYPRPDLPSLVRAIGAPAPEDELAVRPPALSYGRTEALQMGPLPGPVAARAKSTPLSPGRYGLQFTVDQATHDKLGRAQELLGHAVPAGDVGKVFDRALDVLIRQLEKQRRAKCDHPRAPRGAGKGRHIPAEVKRAVFERDGEQCTFVSERGHRCEARVALELDHIQPVARGGKSTIGNLRVRCRAHNQFAAEQAYGDEFMRDKRTAAREQAARQQAAKAEAQTKAGAEAQAREAAEREAKDVIPWLQALGYNLATARRGAGACAHIPDASLEDRIKAACQALARHCIQGPGRYATRQLPAT